MSVFVCVITWNVQCLDKAIEVISFRKKFNVVWRALSIRTITYFSCSEERHSSALRSVNTDFGLLLTHFVRLSIRFRTNYPMLRIQSNKILFLVLGHFLFLSIILLNLQQHSSWTLTHRHSWILIRRLKRCWWGLGRCLPYGALDVTVCFVAVHIASTLEFFVITSFPCL